MKRPALAILLLLCAMLSGCSLLVPAQFTQISAHSAAQSGSADTDVPTVSSYSELRAAIRSFAENGVAHGVIRAANYSGDVAQDLSRASYSVAREDPVGAYAIDFLTHDCTLIVSYYEITIDITFRSMAEDPRTLDYVTSQKDVQAHIRSAMDAYAGHATWYAVSDRSYDYADLARQIYESDPLRYMALPEIHTANYPEGGRSRIVELTLTWPADAAALEKMERAVEESLQAASVYVRYRDTDWEKINLLYTYLLERFSYTEQETATPLYSALCEGLITSRSAAAAWQLLCQSIGIPCQLVDGSRDGEEYFWTMVELDGRNYHVDLLRDLLSEGQLNLRYDEDMGGYSWDMSLYPACPKPEPPAEPDEPAPEEAVPQPDAQEEAAQPDAAQESADVPEKERRNLQRGS